MIINTKSWHYRLLKSLDCNIPRSLCPYFWKTVLMSMFVLMMSVIALIAVSLFAYGIGYMSFMPKEFSWEVFASMTILDHIKCVLYSLAFDVVGAFGTFVFFYTISSSIRSDVNEFVYEKVPRDKREFEYYHQYYRNKRKNKKPKQKSLIIAYLKARKEKICPTLEFKE